MTRLIAVTAVALVAAFGSILPAEHAATSSQTRAAAPSRAEILAAMKRATAFMVERVSTNGGYVWAYLPDLSRRWGEMEARPSMIWMQPPGTATMGHLFLDAYHATGDEYYYQAAERTAGAVIWAQLPSGGWNYVADLAGELSLREWYATVGKNGWRLEEFQHYWGNATFDDVVTVDAARLLLRLYLEKRDPKYKPSLDKAIQFVLDSQYPIGAWPQRYPPKPDFIPDYTADITFNDDVAAENIEFLLQCYQTLGDGRLVDPILRGMQAFIVLQQGPPQPGWGLQYSLDFQVAGARTYEPRALVTHTTARNIELLIRFYRLTGDRKFLARVPEAIDWLANLTLPPGVAPANRTHPTFVEVGTNRPLYVHREGSNVVNGRYYVNYDSAKTIGHYSAFRRVDIAGLRKLYDEAKALSLADATKGSPLKDPAAPAPLRFVALDPAATESTVEVIANLKPDGAWIAPLEYVSYPYRGDGKPERPSGDFSQTHVGDESDTSPFPNTTVLGISTTTYIRRMTVLIRALTASTSAAPPSAEKPTEAVTWRLDNLTTIGGHPVTRLGAPRVVTTEIGPAIEFNGRTDGLLLETNPLEGLRAFTLEAQFQPATDGPEEQRFVHIEEHDTGNRALLESRTLPGGNWCLDTFLKSGTSSRTLLDRQKTHPAGQWHVAALVYDGAEMSHYVDGQRETSGPVSFAPLGPGRTALGVRLNQVSWFHGRLRLLRVTPEALPPDRLLRTSGVFLSSQKDTRGPEGQRKADLGNGSFLNPIMAGDHPDPTVLKDGDDYYMTFSSFDAYPGLVIWHSRDLVNWTPVVAALQKNVGSIWAPDLVKHRGRYYIYFPAVGPYRSNYVIWADSIRGPWSDPIDLKVGRIDPGHAVGPDGRRFLFLSNGELAPLADDGLSVTGTSKRIYEGWKYPDDWVVESFSQEGPKILKRGEYYYMVLAEGGTAGPPTGHMIVAARSKTIEGPWENSPYNPIVRTQSSSERWWSKGHGTLVEGPRDRWFIVYHAYENGFYTLGRQTLLEPIEWTADGWFRTLKSDLAGPIQMPAPTAGPHGQALSDDFTTNKMGVQWGFYAGTDEDRTRIRYDSGALVLRAKGQTPADSAPLSFVAGDHAYEVEVTIDPDPDATAGLLLFYSRKLYAGLGVTASRFVLHRYGTERLLERPAGLGRSLRLRLRNDRHIVTISYSPDGKTWTRFGTAMEVSGYHHNVAGEFLSLRPAIYAAGRGEVRFRQFVYRALE